MGKLTVKKVESLSAPGRYSDGDGSGFHVRVDGAGRKYWVLRLKLDGRRKDVAIGSVARMSLGAARERARELRERIERTGGGATIVPTFAEAAVLAHRARTVGYSNAKHVAQWLATLEAHANPVIGAKRVDVITRGDIVAVLAPVWLKTPETARRIMQRIDRVMRWAVGHQYREHRIDMALVRDALPPQPKQRAAVRRMPAVAWEEAPTFYQSIAASRSAPEVRMGLQLLTLTAVRPGNIRAARREHFDLDAGVWTIPAEDMKVKHNPAHRVPLAPPAVEIARALMALHDRALLFAVSGRAISTDTLRMTMRRMGRTETPHGLRSTFKEWSLADGWPDQLSEIALAHADPNEVRAAYARSDRLEERRAMMLAWAAFLAGSPHSRAAPGRERASGDPA